MPSRMSDYIYHPPSGSSYPGKEEANPYDFYAPSELRHMVEVETDPEELAKIKSSLRKWERIYQYPGYPWRVAAILRKLAAQLIKADAYSQPANIPYYQESDIPQGVENVLNILKPTDDNYNDRRFDYSRQGERPKRDIDTGRGDFLSPNEPLFNNGQGAVWPRGEGPNPDIEYPFPPTGGNLGAI